MDILKKIYGEDHPDLNIELNNFGLVLYLQGKLEKAEEYF